MDHPPSVFLVGASPTPRPCRLACRRRPRRCRFGQTHRDMQLCRGSDHPQGRRSYRTTADRRSSPPPPPALADLSHGRVELERNDDARRFKAALDVQRPIAGVANTCRPKLQPPRVVGDVEEVSRPQVFVPLKRELVLRLYCPRRSSTRMPVGPGRGDSRRQSARSGRAQCQGLRTSSRRTRPSFSRVDCPTGREGCRPYVLHDAHCDSSRGCATNGRAARCHLTATPALGAAIRITPLYDAVGAWDTRRPHPSECV